jgi:tryptophan synthase beta subunit
MANDPTSIREALLVEVMQDVDQLLARLEAVKEGLASQVAQATKDAVGQALLASRLAHGQMIDEKGAKLMAAASGAAAEIEGATIAGATRLVAAGARVERGATRILVWLTCAMLGAGLIGGVVGVLVVRWLER